MTREPPPKEWLDELAYRRALCHGKLPVVRPPETMSYREIKEREAAAGEML